MVANEEARTLRGTGNAGAARAGVEGLPGVLSTKIRVLLRPGGVEGHPGS